MLICYHFRSEALKGIPKKVELVEAVTDIFESIVRVLCRGRGGGVGGSVVTNEAVHEAGEDIGGRSRFLV